MTLERRTPLKRTEFKRTTAKSRTRKPPRSGSDFSARAKKAITRRAWGGCEVGLPGCSGQLEQHHHRKMRSQGGHGTASNGLGVCMFCHTKIHAYPQWAYMHGLLVRSHHDPDTVAVFSGCSLGCTTNHTFPPPVDNQPSRP